MSIEFCYEHDSYYDTDFHEKCWECLADELPDEEFATLSTPSEIERMSTSDLLAVYDRWQRRKLAGMQDVKPLRVREAADLDTASESEVFCLSRRYLCQLQDHNPGGARMGYRSQDLT